MDKKQLQTHEKAPERQQKYPGTNRRTRCLWFVHGTEKIFYLATAYYNLNSESTMTGPFQNPQLQNHNISSEDKCIIILVYGVRFPCNKYAQNVICSELYVKNVRIKQMKVEYPTRI